MARARDSIMKDLRDMQKQLLTAKSRRNAEKVKTYRARLAELQKEYDATI